MSDQQQRTQWASDLLASFVDVWTPPGARAAIQDSLWQVDQAIRAIAPPGQGNLVGYAVFKREIDTAYDIRQRPSGFVHTQVGVVCDKPGQVDNLHQSQAKKYPEQEFIIGEIRQTRFSKDR